MNYVTSISDTIAYFMGLNMTSRIVSRTPLLYNISKNDNAFLLRVLCMHRSSVYRNWNSIMSTMNAVKSIDVESYDKIMNNIDYVSESYNSLSINFNMSIDKSIIPEVKDKYSTEIIILWCDYLNKLIEANLTLLREYVPYWVDIPVLENLFKTPVGLDDKYSYSSTISLFEKNIKKYPFQCWMNLPNYNNSAIMFNNDYNFIQYLYQSNGLEIPNDLVFEADEIDSREFFLDCVKNEKYSLVVDCENFDPYKLVAFINFLKNNADNAIEKIVLIDDCHTNKVWRDFHKLVEMPVQHLTAERIIPDKSCVDAYLSTWLSKEYYVYQNTNFILASSDSDYIPIIESMNGANYIILYENSKWSRYTSKKLDRLNVRYISVDNLNIATVDIENDIISNEIYDRLNNYEVLDLNKFLGDVYLSCRVSSKYSRKDFIDIYLSDLAVQIKDDKLVISVNKINK